MPMSFRAPNAWLVAACALAIGSAIGGGTATIESAVRPWKVGDFAPAAFQPPDGSDAPQVDVAQTHHAFGTIGAGAEGSHDFVIGNTGTVPLRLSRGATSCSCTVSDFEVSDGATDTTTKEVAPGTTTKVLLKWRGKGSGGPFRQQATIFTNDPRRTEIAFVIEGTVVPTWKAVPESIVLSKLSSSSGEKATARIFTFGKEPPVIGELSTEGPQASQFFSLSWSALEPHEIAAETGATGGFLLRVDVRPGLPLGPLRDRIQIPLRIPEEITAELLLEGTVAGDLALAGTAWDSSRQALLLGTISSKAGAHTELFLTAKGPHRDAVQPVVREVLPKSLDVFVGKGKPIGSGSVIRIPITITIPPDSPPSNHLCSQQALAGRIVLDTGHPDTPTLTIPVCIAIGP